MAEWANESHLSCSNVTAAAPAASAIRRRSACASPGHAAGSSGHQACASCSGSRVTSAPGASQACPIEHRHPVGEADERLDREPLRARPTTPPRARARARARGPRRPRPRRRRRAPSGRPTRRPTPRAGRRASGRPRRAPRTARTASRARRPDQPQRPAQRLELDGQPAVAGLVAGEPGGPAVVRGRAAVVQRGDRRVGLRGEVRGGLVAVLAPAGRDLVGRPGSAREDAGLHRLRVAFGG